MAKKQKILLSIVTPCYNSEKYIEQCIKSIMSQDCPNYEHIIVDGGSTDGTIEIIKKYENKYNMKWVSEKDNGMYDAISKGFALSKGEVLSWLNSDDIYFPWTVRIVTRLFEENEDIKWITGIPSNLSSKGVQYSPTFYKPLFYSQASIAKGKHHGKGHGFIQQESTFWKKELWKKCNGLDKSLKYAGDFDLWRRFAEYEKLYTVDALLACFRIHEGQKSGDIISYYKEIKRYCTWGEFFYWLLNKMFRINRIYSWMNRRNLKTVHMTSGVISTKNKTRLKLYVKEILLKK